MTYVDTQRKALGEGELFAVKISNREQVGATKWINANADQVKRILDILSESDSYYTLTSNDVGATRIRAFGMLWSVENFIGQIQPRDVGKRVYKHPAGHLTVENDKQRNKRVATD